MAQRRGNRAQSAERGDNPPPHDDTLPDSKLPDRKLRYNEARAALELVLTELQASDLDVEVMASLYQRGQAYARHCEAILAQVEQEVLLWDGLEGPDQAPSPWSEGDAAS